MRATRRADQAGGIDLYDLVVVVAIGLIALGAWLVAGAGGLLLVLGLLLLAAGLIGAQRSGAGGGR